MRVLSSSLSLSVSLSSIRSRSLTLSLSLSLFLSLSLGSPRGIDSKFQAEREVSAFSRSQPLPSSRSSKPSRFLAAARILRMILI